MTNLFKKNELVFSLVWIFIYILGSGFCDGFSTKLYTFIFHAFLSIFMFWWLYKNALLEEYGLCKATVSNKCMLYYLPLLLIISCNLWFGVKMQFTITETVFYVLSMLFVGFLEEMMFRGFLFKAISKDDLKMAIVISSVTFGVGHILNLFNGSGMELVASVCQVGYAMAFGYLAVMLFLKTKSLIACIFAHSIMNILSAFSNVEIMNTTSVQIIVSLILIVVSIGYALYIKNMPNDC